jgi:hypothetical protein
MSLLAITVMISLSIICAWHPNSIWRHRATFLFADHTSASIESTGWPGNRPPIPNLEFLDQRMEATWGRGKFREEIWQDRANPVNDWWTAYAPSPEETEAAAAGYDFGNPRKWHEV